MTFQLRGKIAASAIYTINDYRCVAGNTFARILRLDEFAAIPEEHPTVRLRDRPSRADRAGALTYYVNPDSGEPLGIGVGQHERYYTRRRPIEGRHSKPVGRTWRSTGAFRPRVRDRPYLQNGYFPGGVKADKFRC